MKGWLGVACNAVTGEAWSWEMPGVSKWWAYFDLGMSVNMLRNGGTHVTSGSYALYEMDGNVDELLQRYMSEQYPALRFMETGVI
jgi:hypothetical protein